MSFSFNWAGVTVPQAQRRDTMDKSVAAAGMLGKAVKGYQDYRGNQEYADMIREAQGAPTKEAIAAVEAEIARLEARNQELLRARAMSQAASQGMLDYRPAGGPEAAAAAAQMRGYGAFQEGMQNQGIQAGNILAALNAQNYRQR